MSGSNGKDSKEPPTLSDSIVDGEVLDSHVGFDDQEIIDQPDSNEDAVPGENLLDEQDGKETGYLDRLKSVFGDH